MSIFVTKRNGTKEALNLEKINQSVIRCTNGLSVSVSDIILTANLQFYDGISTKEIDNALIMSCCEKIFRHIDYSYAAGNILLNIIYKEVLGKTIGDSLDKKYREAFIKGISNSLLSKELLKFDLDYLASHLIIKNDKFEYRGIKTLYDSYMIKGVETPQAFFMRVSMGLALNEKPEDRNYYALKFYQMISNHQYMPSTPTLFNSGTNFPQLSSCYLSTIHDSEDGIMGSMHDQARLSKYAGGLGVDFGHIRSASKLGNYGFSSGVIPFMKIFNSVVAAFNQAGRRRGSGAAYYPCYYLDFEDFIDLRKNTGDERRRCHDINTAAWIPDLFMQRVEEDGEWTLFNPKECPDLHETFHEKFNELYQKYESRKHELNHKTVRARDLWKKMLLSLPSTGHPWICFKDMANLCYTNQNEGVVFSSNLCTEIIRHTKYTTYSFGRKEQIGETAVCNLGSINLEKFLVKNGDRYYLDYDAMIPVIKLAVRALDNVIDINFYPIEEAKVSNMKHRPVGLGYMGFAHVLQALKIPYDSDEAVNLSSRIASHIAYHAILASSDLGKERGNFQSFVGSTWQQGKLPQDLFDEAMKLRGFNDIVLGESNISEVQWNELRNRVSKNMRNSSLIAVAPTATISTIVGSSPSIDPDYSVFHVYSTLRGEFSVLNKYFLDEIYNYITEEKWLNEVYPILIQYDLSKIDNSLIPNFDRFYQIYKPAFEIDVEYLIKCAAARQRYIDMGQSFNLFVNTKSLKRISDIYFLCWKSGLKTTYYFRTKASSSVEKSVREKEDINKSVCNVDSLSCDSCQ
ncbi:MAG: ribonucleoside-diphosphate reductase subunit alpha [Bacteroidales bacterium]